MGAIISLSGGMDSATLLAAVCNYTSTRDHVLAVSFDYGSKHGDYEQACAVKLAHFYGVEQVTIDVRPLFWLSRSALMKGKGVIPEGHYQTASMKATVVPGRNLIFASILAGIAQSRGADRVYLGVHAGDHAIYPDCRPSFVMSLRETVVCSSEGTVKVEAPFLHMNKAEILKTGVGLRVPYHLTRTCYKDQPIACGKCGSCQERLEAFQLCGQTDPAEYEIRDILPKGA